MWLSLHLSISVNFGQICEFSTSHGTKIVTRLVNLVTDNMAACLQEGLPGKTSVNFFNIPLHEVRRLGLEELDSPNNRFNIAFRRRTPKYEKESKKVGQITSPEIKVKPETRPCKFRRLTVRAAFATPVTAHCAMSACVYSTPILGTSATLSRFSKL